MWCCERNSNSAPTAHCREKETTGSLDKNTHSGKVREKWQGEDEMCLPVLAQCSLFSPGDLVPNNNREVKRWDGEVEKVVVMKGRSTQRVCPSVAGVLFPHPPVGCHASR